MVSPPLSWFLMIGPALVPVLVGGAIMIWLAMARPDAMVVGDYYKHGKATNQDWQVVVEGGARDWRLAGNWSRVKQPVLAIAADPVERIGR